MLSKTFNIYISACFRYLSVCYSLIRLNYAFLVRKMKHFTSASISVFTYPLDQEESNMVVQTRGLKY